MSDASRLPAELAALLAGGSVEPAPLAGHRSTVRRVHWPDGRVRYWKHAPRSGPGEGAELLDAEAQRLRWLQGHLPVPEVVAHLTDPDDGSVHLVTTGLPGRPATAAHLAGDVLAHLAAIGRGLRRVHELPIDSCPFRTGLDERLALAAERLELGLVDPATFEPAYARYTPERLYELLAAARPDGEEDLVVVHGDPSLPNLLLDTAGVCGYVDLGRCGVADRHLDLAICARSIARNIDREALGPFLAAYGPESPSLARIDFYVLLDEFF